MLLIIGFFISLIYISFILACICNNDLLLPSCDNLENKQHFEDILKLKSCEHNKCYNIKAKYYKKENYEYKNNYLCNTKLSDFIINNNDENSIKCVNIPKEKINNVFISSKSMNIFLNGKNMNNAKIINYFLISCDYDFYKPLYFCNSKNELNPIQYKLTDFYVINDYEEFSDIIDKRKETKYEIIYKNGECMTLFSFLSFIFLNLFIFFLLPIKVDIWYNEKNRFEIIKRKIYQNHLRVSNDQQNYIYHDDASTSTDNSSEKSSESNISDNSDVNNNIFAVIQN
jgi:hypothetical protein